MTTLCDQFLMTARRHANRVAVHHLDRDWTYGQLRERAEQLAGWFGRHGLEKGDRVGLLLPNSADYVVCYFGVLLAGGVVVALNPETTPSELSRTLVHCRPAAVVVAANCERHLAPLGEQLVSLRIVVRLDTTDSALPISGCDGSSLEAICSVPNQEFDGVRVKPHDIAQIIYTSGTSGHPKGVMLSHRNLVANCDSIVDYLDLKAESSVFVILPFFYSYGNSLLVTHMAVGGRLILASDFVFWKRALDLMEQQQATGFSGVPSSFAMLMHKTDFVTRDFPHLRYLTCAGGGLAPATIARLREAMPKASLFLMYGQTEAAARLSTLMPQDLPRKVGSIGRGIKGVELSVLDEEGKRVTPGEMGEIVARGDNVMLGYWNDPVETGRVLRGGMLHTSDMARVDDDGYIFIVGRRSDIIKSGAYRINPQEIEETILELEQVAEVAVVGEPDEILGQVVVAHVVPRTDDDARALEAEVIAHCKRQLPRYKHPRRAVCVDSLPKTASGKIKRAELRQVPGDDVRR